jgi:class 3 adenylate cyclase
MLDQGNRTFIGSVVFVDIIGYARRSVSEQIQIKDRFTNLLSDALADISPEQRLILDTGDGAALSFLGDPEDALFVSMNLRDLVGRARAANAAAVERGEEASVELPLRIGINLGPVKLARDINGHPNIVGDGINVAQRIMSFAQAGQIVVSRSFFDVVSVISEEYAKLFRYEGSRTDKHVREHEIYVVGESESAFNKAKAGSVDRASTTGPNAPAALRGIATGTHAIPAPAPFLQDQRKLMMAGGGLGIIVLALVAALMSKRPVDNPALPFTPRQESMPAAVRPDSAVTAPVAAGGIAPISPTSSNPPAAAPGTPPGAEKAPETAPLAPAPAAASMETPASSTAVGSTLPAESKAGRVEAAKADSARTILTLGTVFLSIDPWGEVFINGKSIGTSPPVKQHKLAPGKYKIEVRNTSFTPFVLNVDVKAREDLRIKHKFQ